MATEVRLYELIKEVLPNDHARQISALDYIEPITKLGALGKRVMDLGCGAGSSADAFRAADPTVEWHGVDLQSSPEVETRTRTDVTFHTFDGVRLPFRDNQFDIIYSRQVFEHVRHPEALLGHVERVLKPGGAFIGSLSYLEPYHSLSYWNYTPYGWYELLKAAKLKPLEFRPGIDAIALIQRHYGGKRKEHSPWFTSSPLNEEIDKWGAETGRRPQLVNLRKLQYCGHLVFYATKPT